MCSLSSFSPYKMRNFFTYLHTFETRLQQLVSNRPALVPLSLPILTVDPCQKFSLLLQCRATRNGSVYSSQSSSSSSVRGVKVIFFLWKHIAILFPAACNNTCEDVTIVPSCYEHNPRFLTGDCKFYPRNGIAELDANFELTTVMPEINHELIN
jgi:hypothetical protein